MKKSLEISAKFDTSDFDKSVDRMQKKLKDLYAPSDMVRMQTQTAARMNQMGMGATAPGQAERERATLKYRKELDTYIGEEFKKQEALLKNISARSSVLERLKEQQKSLVTSSQEELKVREQIGKLEENQAKRRDQYRQRDESINAAISTKRAQQADIMQGYQMGGLAGAARAGMHRLAQTPGGMLGVAGGLIATAGAAYNDYGQSSLRTAGSAGNAVQSTVGQEANNIYSRRSAFESAFNPERARAAEMALRANSGARVGNATGLAGNILGYAGLGAGAGSAFAGIGAVPGAIGGALYGGYKAFSDPSQRSLALSPFSSRYNEEYENGMAQRLGGDYQKTLGDLRNQNPGKNLASQYYEQSYMGNLQSQRSMGMGDEQMYGMGGYLQGGVNGGFTPEMMTGMSQGILGAGGSSRSASGNALFGNQLSRNMDLTNSSGILGSLSGGLGSSEATRQATIKILAEGTKLGLDDSKFAEENRRFTQAAAEIVSRSGASGNDVDRVAGGFGKFMGDTTVAGVNAAKSAYEQYQQISSSTTGPRGVMRAAGFLKDEKLSQLSTIQKQALMQLPEEQLNESNPLVAGLASSVGTSANDLIARVRGVNQGAVSRFKSADMLRDRLRARNIDVSKSGDPSYMKSLSTQDQIDVGNLMAYQTTELGNQGQREMISRAAGTVGRPEGFGPGVGESAVEGRLSAPTGRSGDTTVSETAKDFGVVLQNFRDFKKEIIPSAEAIANFTNRIREMMIVLRSASESDIPGLVKYYTNERAKNQTQAGKTSR